MCRYRTNCGSRSPHSNPCAVARGDRLRLSPSPFLFANGELVDSASVTAALVFLCAICYAHRHTMSTARGKAFRPLQLRVPLQSQEETFYYLGFLSAHTHTPLFQRRPQKETRRLKVFPFPPSLPLPSVIARGHSPPTVRTNFSLPPLLCPQRDQTLDLSLLYRGPRVHLAASMLFVEDPSSVSGCFAIVGGGERDVGLNPTQPGRNEKERERELRKP